MLEGYRVSEEHKKYIHLCIHIIKWKGCSDQKFMTSFSRVVVTLICFVVFFPSILSIVLTRSPTCMFLSLSSILPPIPPFFHHHHRENVDNTEVYISPNMFSFRTSSESSNAQTRKFVKEVYVLRNKNFCLSVFSLKAPNAEGQKLNSQKNKYKKILFPFLSHF